MKALVFEAPDKPVVAEMPMPELKDNEVLVRTAAIGICHSDYELLAGRYIIPITYPVRPGHEWSGEIVEIGKLVKGLKVGDRVIGECVFRTPERVHHFGFSTDGADCGSLGLRDSTQVARSCRPNAMASIQRSN